MAAQKVYMKSDKESLLSVSRGAMRLPEVHMTVERADDEPAGAPPESGAHVRFCKRYLKHNLPLPVLKL